MQTTDFMIHIDETLAEPQLEAVEDSICHTHGVLSAGHPAGKPHLVQICYDSDTTRVSTIIGELRHQGFHAQAVAM